MSITHIVKEVRYVLPMAWRQAGVILNVPVLADEVVWAHFGEDEVEDALGELAHQLHRQLVGDEEVAIGEHVGEAVVQGLVGGLVVVVVPQDIGNLDVGVVFFYCCKIGVCQYMFVWMKWDGEGTWVGECGAWSYLTKSNLNLMNLIDSLFKWHVLTCLCSSVVGFLLSLMAAIIRGPASLQY